LAVRKKLENEGFVSRAPANVVQGERDKARQTEEELARLRTNLSDLG
jgi:valyl-tRNA synthetase